jgi:glutamate racemase
LLAEELGAAFPNVTYVDGGPGIARRIAYLTRGQPWPAHPSQGLMVFTSAIRHPSPAALQRFAMGEIRTL